MVEIHNKERQRIAGDSRELIENSFVDISFIIIYVSEPKRLEIGYHFQLQGWYNKLQRDEVVAEWKKVQGKMSLHVHCHISGGHFLLDLFARLRFFIFYKELPVVKTFI